MTDTDRRIGPHQTDQDQQIAAAVALVVDELKHALTAFPPFRSGHEGFAIILEELDEMWHEVKHGTPQLARDEAIQVAAMALRYLIDAPGDQP